MPTSPVLWQWFLVRPHRADHRRRRETHTPAERIAESRSTQRSSASSIPTLSRRQRPSHTRRAVAIRRLYGSPEAVISKAHVETTWKNVRPPEGGRNFLISLVAGAGFEPATFGL